MGRIRLAEKNIAFGYIGQAATALMSFILRTVFIQNLAEQLLGINSLYTNVLSILSMAELGIGTALNFALYRPVADKDTEKVKSYMQMYRKAYNVIAIVVALIGLAIAPFLRYLIKKPGTITVSQMELYYFIFLFNTVSTYFVSYKYSLVNAQQKNYIQTNINTITKIITTLLQIIVVIVTKNFLLYLLTDMFVQLAQKFFVNWYLNKLYPFLKDRNVQPLSKAESGEVWTKTKALIFHKVGDVARLQTDSLIISSFIEVAVAGFVDNYVLVINAVSNFVNIIFNSVISGFGNLIATESKERQYQLFRVYRFFASWIYGYAVTGFWILLTPLVRLWLGDAWVLPFSAVALILTDLYFKGDRLVLSNFKTAAGVFEPDKYLALIQGAVNLVLSIWLVQKIGLPGIYVGTVVSGLIANVTKPFIIYRVCFDRKATSYFSDSMKYIVTVAAVIAVCTLISGRVLAQLNIGTFLLMAVIITVIFNGVFFLLFGRSEEFRYLVNMAGKKSRRIGGIRMAAANDQIMQEIAEEARRELCAIPAPAKIKDGLKTLAKKAAGGNVPPKDPIFWPAGLLLLGLWEAGDENTVAAYLDQWIARGTPVLRVDDAVTGYVLCRLYEATHKAEYRAAADQIWAYLDAAEKDADGALIYLPGRGNDYILADGIGQSAMFLSTYAAMTGTKEARELAERQLSAFWKNCFDDNTGLPYHAYDPKDHVKYGIIGWGRAVGWLLMGASCYLAAFAGDEENSEQRDCDSGGTARAETADPDPLSKTAKAVTVDTAPLSKTEEQVGTYQNLKAAFRELAQNTLRCLRRDHLFSWQLEAVEGPCDTSATGMIAWSLLHAKRAGIASDFTEDTAVEIAAALLAQVNDGKVFGSLSECIDLAQHPQRYGNYPWGQGAVLAYLALLAMK